MLEKVIFYPQKNNADYCDKWKDAEVILSINQEKLQGWFVKAADQDDPPVLIYYGGNAEDISFNLSYSNFPSASLFLMNYRGFGKSSGHPTQEGLFSDALAIYDHLVNMLNINPDKIYLIGRSIGSSIAAYVASQRRVGGLILITPYDSIANLAPKFLRFFPIKEYLEGYFNTSKHLEHVKGKFLIIAAGSDEIIPRKCLENLLAKYQDQVVFVEIKDANHQNISQYHEFANAIERYIHGWVKDVN